ncbi:hypothetical protein D3C77_495660 [compost metagenome]
MLRCARQQDDELFSAITAAYMIWLYRFRHLHGQKLQHMISSRMAVGIIYPLEMIDIQHYK